MNGPPVPEVSAPGRELARSLLARCEKKQDFLRDELRALVEIESPSGDEAGLALARARVRERLSAIGIASEVEAASGALVFRAPLGATAGARPVLAIAHLDTVWPRGTLARRGFRIEGDRAFGPGSFDTKAGVVLLLAALEALAEEGPRGPRPIVGFLSVDEETGSSRSRERVRELARAAQAALILEPALGPEGALKTARTRALTPGEAERVDASLRGLAPALEGTSLRVEGAFDRPPLVRTEAVAACFELARGIARDLGFSLSEGTVGGGSDGCHTAPHVATLDGLGAVGAGAHAEEEHVVLSWLPRRAALLASLLISFP
ncbi:M20/M25/M40 family metallo-hydrolase [bacterium]|nr:M20/M25/M40 family metallo-hydrolase [bacterium]